MPQKRDWREVLRTALIRAGTNGIQQMNLLRLVRSWRVTADELVAQLEQWRAIDAVQRFHIAETGPRGGRPATVWRATTVLPDVEIETELEW